MQLLELVRTSKAVAATRSRREKTDVLARCLGHLAPTERRAGASWLAGELEGGKLGLGPAALSKTRDVPPSPEAHLTVEGVSQAFEQMRSLAGPGSQGARHEAFVKMLSSATNEEQDFLRRLVLGELRQGALLSLLLDALAQAAQVSVASVRRAHMFAGALGPVVEAALGGGEPGLDQFDLVLFEPVQPMLAQPAEDLDEAWARLHDPYLELKMDGARVQIHRSGDDVRIFTRRLNDVTASLPDIVDAVKRLDVRQTVLDGEVIALGPDDRPLSFQTTMRRFGRASSSRALTEQIPLSLFAFDCLHVDGQTLIDRPARTRIEATAAWLTADVGMPRLWTPTPESARAFVSVAYERGHEGAMAKAKGATYDAGRRGGQWLKIKQAFTVDLVVLGAEWGSGRRRGWLSNLHLGALGPGGSPIMVGKTFKGLTDARLRWQTAALLEREVERWAHGVRVRPDLVVEIAFGGIQASDAYPGGLSLRFARVRRFRPDKDASQIESLAGLRDFIADSG